MILYSKLEDPKSGKLLIQKSSDILFYVYFSEIDRIKNINHSILNLTSDVKTTAVASSLPLFSAAPTDQSRILVGKKLLASSTHQTAQSLASLSNINTTEASPKKKPRKQSM